LLLAARAAATQPGDPYVTTFGASCDVVYHETDRIRAQLDIRRVFDPSVDFNAVQIFP
jgi:hypothetical protein